MKVIAVMAMTVDGKIAINEKHFPDWTGKADKQLFKQRSMKAGALIMGSKTFDTIGKPLPNRKNIVMTRNPLRRSSWENLVFCSNPPQEILEKLDADGFQEVILAGGASVNTLFAKAGLIDELILTYAPKIFGRGVSLFSEPVRIDLNLKELKLIEKEIIFAHYEVQSFGAG